MSLVQKNSTGRAKKQEEVVTKPKLIFRTFPGCKGTKQDQKLLKTQHPVEGVNMNYSFCKTKNNFRKDKRPKSKQKLGSQFNTGRWNEEEHHKFIEAILKYGNEWKKVQNHVETRSSTQARSHAQKFFIKMKTKCDINLSFELGKNDIKKLHELALSMDSEEYFKTINNLNLLNFERKIKGKRINSEFANKDSESKEDRFDKHLMESDNFDFKIQLLKEKFDLVKEENAEYHYLNQIKQDQILPLNICKGTTQSEIFFTNRKRSRNNSFTELEINPGLSIFCNSASDSEAFDNLEEIEEAIWQWFEQEQTNSENPQFQEDIFLDFNFELPNLAEENTKESKVSKSHSSKSSDSSLFIEADISYFLDCF